MNCCRQCFQDKNLVQHIRNKGRIGNCNFCGAKRVCVVPAESLREIFAPLIGLFAPLEYGKHFDGGSDPDRMDIGENLPTCIESKKNWKIFNVKLSDRTRCDLMDAIRGVRHQWDGNGGTPSRDYWASQEDEMFYISEEDIWHEFVETIKWKRRFIPDLEARAVADPRAWLPQFLHKLQTFADPKDSYHRARLGGVADHHTVSRPYPACDMSIPPKTKATAGRANPAGIPYLYVAEKEMTAVSEIRPFLGGHVTVASVRPRKPLQLVDLTVVRKIESPFGLANLQMELEQNALLRILNRELAKPVNPALAEIDYIPTQYLAEVILNAGYDGIRYKSAMHSGGFNVVFFDHEKLEICPTTKLVQITANRLEYK